MGTEQKYLMLFNFLGIGGGIGYGSLGLTPENPGPGRIRATTEAILTYYVMEYFSSVLKKEELYDTFQNVEMPALITLARMELNGFGMSFVVDSLFFCN